MYCIVELLIVNFLLHGYLFTKSPLTVTGGTTSSIRINLNMNHQYSLMFSLEEKIAKESLIFYYIQLYILTKNIQ